MCDGLELPVISSKDFKEFIARDLEDLFSVSDHMTKCEAESYTHPMIRRLHLEATRVEEVLDAFGALQNKEWRPLRKVIAAIKAFSEVGYTLVYIQRLISSYNLVKLPKDFQQATKEMVQSIFKILKGSCEELSSLLKGYAIPMELFGPESYHFEEAKVMGRLEVNWNPKAKEASDTAAIYLATSFLNTAERSHCLQIYKEVSIENFHTVLTNNLSEEDLRLLEDKFHSLQSLYDTRLRGTEVTLIDQKLPTLQEHISLIYQLLKGTTVLVHYYERHVPYFRETETLKAPIPEEKLLKYIKEYFTYFPDQYIQATRTLCKEILKYYAIMGEVTVPIPNYRGFHVRPSTLIAKIVDHYGGVVTMELMGQSYNAAMPLDLFRANEALNRAKRKKVFATVLDHKHIANKVNAVYDPDRMKKTLRVIFLDLLEKQQIMMYDSNFSLGEITPGEDEPIGEFVHRGISLYMAMGKIDIVSDESVVFKGDKRVLEDLSILAHNGYGEDKFGNNIVLPPELSYLKR